MGAAARVTRREWKPGEKAKHSTRNDIRSLETSLHVLRNRNPKVGRLRSWLVRRLGGTVGSRRETAEIRRLEALLGERRAELARLCDEFG